MKLFNWIFKLVVLLLSLPAFLLLVCEGACLVVTDGIPGLLKKLSILRSGANN
ncbi:MAG TPA: hypothetical protein VFG19_17245 [Geobacteraceae bacterium]|nr:hypothetical protein [Geobacteraceae bacterium]